MSGKMRWDEVTAIFGGTFDPPHLGHREAIEGLFKNPGVRRVIIIPSATPPQKPNSISSTHRVQMTKLLFGDKLTTGEATAISELSKIKKLSGEVLIDLCEIERSEKGKSPSYSFDTLLEKKREYPQLAFVLGADQLANLPTWHRFPEILGLCHWIVFSRKPDGEAIAFKTLNEWEASGLIKRHPDGFKTVQNSTEIVVCPTAAKEISSRNIRENLARGIRTETARSSLQEALPNELLTYLMEHRLYGTGVARK